MWRVAYSTKSWAAAFTLSISDTPYTIQLSVQA